MARPGPTSKLERTKQEAMRVAWERFPDADDIRPCLVLGEIRAEVWRGRVCFLEPTEVYL